MTELERICLKQNGTELRRIAKVMSALQDADRNEIGFLTRQISVNEEIDDLKDRLNDVVHSMKSLQEVLKIPLRK